ncbi:ABC transporter ATP-binding protein [Hoeflea prorocentri]|uniref:Sn-glycerol-3-phosphate ABC transporter ATP-binding protein UgpC n=1 Tax=Hoeflea prorocentri TaxID=1922333 RepID=A0A9X3UFH0_9HYPH|nr:sn-glycerol-3-phosphate ABC transporter ATP-binding protein UgpC [Hoeflea prorocentri]MCY6379792.1 sn-glycerol-3-phosphate ABC transporter ATP-binding protein UgpC [Hoeflea prorocentri]MDA5397592.1 sn-glycerol-3-phosphate ABC transporter ATP-binding protein UgpC [Hoeflea prorocentri]
MGQLVLNNVRKSYGTVDVIKGVDLNIERGDFCVFVGPSGCGKSTLLRMVSGLEAITDGTIAIDGQVVNDIPAADRGLAMVFQSYALYPHMSVRQNLSFGLENVNTPRAQIDEKVMEVAKMLQIDMLLDRKPKDLSGGQRQRVAIGRAVVREPSIFLFDEPLSNLDAELRVDMRGEIASLHRRLGNTMIYVTHDQVEAMTMADKIAVLRLGEVEQFGAPLDIYNHPANIFVAGFIGSPKMNFMEGTISASGDGKAEFHNGADTSFSVEANRFNLNGDDKVTLGYRPNHLTVVDEDKADLVVSVRDTEQLGGESFVYGNSDDGNPVTIHLSGQTPIEPDTRIGISINREHLHLFSTDTGDSLAAGLA